MLQALCTRKHKLKNLNIAGILLQVNGTITLVFGLFMCVVYVINYEAIYLLSAFLPATVYLIWCLTLFYIGKGIRAANKSYKIAGIIVAVISLVGSPVGIICGVASLVFQYKGKESFINA